VIFGHAKDGNIHFMLTERFDDPRSRQRYAAFTEQMVDLVLGHGGTLCGAKSRWIAADLMFRAG
jgi:D-lactate dehydrogenase